MSRSDVVKYTVAIVAILSAVSLVALFEHSEDAYASSTNDITFDLNGGTLDGQGSFVKTAGELNATGLPDATGSTVPSGKDAFVVWSESSTTYSKLYNAGGTAPSDVTTLYAIWGTNTATSGEITLSGAGCYIISGATNLSVTVNGSPSLLVINNSNLNTLELGNSADVTILLRGENQINELGIQGSGQTIRISSASTGSVNVVNSGVWHISSFIVDGGNLHMDKISTGGSIVINGGTVNIDGELQGHSSIKINEGAIVNCNSVYTEGQLDIDGTVHSDGEAYGKPVKINGTLESGSIWAIGELVINGNVTVTNQLGSSGSITVEGGTIVAGTAWPTPNITGSAVVVIGDKDMVVEGWKYIEIIPDFGTDEAYDISVKFQLNLGSETEYRTLLLPGFTYRINLESELASTQIEVRYFLDGVEYISEGTAIFTSTPTPGHYTVNLGEGTPIDDTHYFTITCSGIGVKVTR